MEDFHCYTGACLLSATYTYNQTMAQVTRSCGTYGQTTGCTYGSNGSKTCTETCTSNYCNLDISEYSIYCYECNSQYGVCSSTSFGVPARTCEYGSCLTITLSDQATGNITDIQRTCGVFHVNKSLCYLENGTNICIDQCTTDLCNLERQPAVTNTTVQPFLCYLCSGSQYSACSYTTLESFEYEVCSTGACLTSVTYYNQTTMEVSRSCAPPGQNSECSYWGNGFITCNSICNDTYKCNGVPLQYPVRCFECNGNTSDSCVTPSYALPIANCDLGTCLTITVTDADTGALTQMMRSCGISAKPGSVTYQQNGLIITVTQCRENYCNNQGPPLISTTAEVLTTTVVPLEPVWCYTCQGNSSTGCGLTELYSYGYEYCYSGSCLLSATYIYNETMAQVTRGCGTAGQTTGCTYGTDGSKTCTEICTSSYCNVDIPEYQIFCYECNSNTSDCSSKSSGYPVRTCEYGSCLTVTVTEEVTGNITGIERTCGVFHVNESACFQENGKNICINQCTTDLCNIEKPPAVANTTAQPTILCYFCSNYNDPECSYTFIYDYEYEVCFTGACLTSVTYYNQTTTLVSRSCASTTQITGCAHGNNGLITCNSVCNTSYCNTVPPEIQITCYECNSNTSNSCITPSSGLPITFCDLGTCLTMTATDAATGTITEIVRSCGVSDIAESVTYEENGQIISVTQCSENYCNYQSGSTNSTLPPVNSTLCYSCSGGIDTDGCGLTSFYDAIDEMCFTGLCALSITTNHNVSQSTISRTCASPGQQSGCTQAADGSLTCTNVCSNQYCNGNPPYIYLYCYECSSYKGEKCDAVSYGLPYAFCNYGSCLAVTVTDQATGNITLVERSCGYYATSFSGCYVQNGQQICASQCTENFCNLDISSGEISTTIKPYNTRCYICSGSENTGCGLSSMYYYTQDVCFSGGCTISATYSINQTTPQVTRSCAAPGQQSGCTYDSDGLLTCTSVCNISDCNANVGEITLYCYECNSAVNVGCMTLTSELTEEICYYGSCSTITVIDEASGNITKVQRGCGGFDMPESGCYEQDGQTACLTQCLGTLCNSEVFQAQAGTTTTTPLPSTFREPVYCYGCSGVENSGCGITSMYDYNDEFCSSGACTTSVTFNYNASQTVTQVSRYCSTPGQTSGCTVETGGSVTCSHVCYGSYCDGTMTFYPVFCYACNSDTDPGCYSLSSVNYEYCTYGSCLTITSTDEATGEVTHIERGCGVFEVSEHECEDQNGQNICITQCTENYCNEVKEPTPTPSTTTPSYSMSLPCYQCNGSLDSACGLGNFNSRQVNEVTCYDQYCATTVTVDYGSYPYSVVSVSRRCSTNINSSCNTESNTEVCTKICSTGLCNGEPTAPPGFHCYLCSGTEDSACGADTFNPVNISIATCPTASCGIMTATGQNDTSLPSTIMRGCSAPAMSEGCQYKNGYQYCYQNCYNNLCNAGTLMSTTSTMPPTPVQCYSCQANVNSDCGRANTNSSLIGEITCYSGMCITTVTTYFYFTYSVTDYTRGCFEPGQIDGCYSSGDISYCNYPCTTDLCNTYPKFPPTGLQCYHCSGADDSICGISKFNSQQVNIETCSASACMVMTVSNVNDPSDITSVIRGCYIENSTLGCVSRNGLEYCYTTCDTNLCNNETASMTVGPTNSSTKTSSSAKTAPTTASISATPSIVAFTASLSTPSVVSSLQCYECSGIQNSDCWTGNTDWSQASQVTCDTGSCAITTTTYDDNSTISRGCGSTAGAVSEGCTAMNAIGGTMQMCVTQCITSLCNTASVGMVGGTASGPTTTAATPSIVTFTSSITAPPVVSSLQCYECSGAQNSYCWTGNTDGSQTSQVNCDTGSCAITTTTYNDGNQTISRGCGSGTAVLSNSCTTINVNGASTQSCITQCITNLCNDQQNNLVSSSDVAVRMSTTCAQIYMYIVVLVVGKMLL